MIQIPTELLSAIIKRFHCNLATVANQSFFVSRLTRELVKLAQAEVEKQKQAHQALAAQSAHQDGDSSDDDDDLEIISSNVNIFDIS